MGNLIYVCATCHHEMKVSSKDLHPICCSKPMKLKEPGCTKPFDAEYSRFEDNDEPCDDGRAFDK